MAKLSETFTKKNKLTFTTYKLAKDALGAEIGAINAIEFEYTICITEEGLFFPVLFANEEAFHYYPELFELWEKGFVTYTG